MNGIITSILWFEARRPFIKFLFHCVNFVPNKPTFLAPAVKLALLWRRQYVLTEYQHCPQQRQLICA